MSRVGNVLEEANRRIPAPDSFEYPKDMIPRHIYDKVEKNRKEAVRIVKSEMPAATMVFVGITAIHIYFNVVAQPTKIDDQQKKDLQQKTRFEPLDQGFATGNIYKASFRMSIM